MYVFVCVHDVFQASRIFCSNSFIYFIVLNAVDWQDLMTFETQQQPYIVIMKRISSALLLSNHL